MKKPLFLKHIFTVLLGNGIFLLASVVLTFLIPKVLGIQDYGFYKLFLLYGSYLPILHLGISDGVYLKFGGLDYKDLPKQQLKKVLKFLYKIQIIFIIALLIIAFFIVDYDRRLIFLLLAINQIPLIISGYYQIISQITSRFKIYTFMNILISILTVIVVFGMFLFNDDSYIHLVFMTISFNYLILLVHQKYHHLYHHLYHHSLDL